jgi:hypothetical protein
MKNTFFVLLLMISLQGYAQQLVVGPTLAAQASRARYDNPGFLDNYKNQLYYGFQAGLVVNYKLNNIISFHTEYNYSMQGKRLQAKFFNEIRNRETYEFLRVPLYLRVGSRAEPGNFSYFFNAGPHLAYLLRARGTVRGTEEVLDNNLGQINYTLTRQNSTSTTEAFQLQGMNRLFVGLDVGIGMLIPMYANRIGVELRYSIGHTNLSDNPSGYDELLLPDNTAAFSNHMLTFRVSYLLEFDLFEIRTKGKSTGK